MFAGFPRRLLAVALLAFGLLAGSTAPAAAMTLGEPPVRLLAPVEGTVLAAGSTAALDWAPSGALAEAAGGTKGWEEWEAFLSLDDGVSYPIRLTPHLDRDLRQVRFRVPSFPTRNGRLLLRVGDERRELAFELPQRFAIALEPGQAGPLGAPEALLASALGLSHTVLRRGEPARPGDPGVLAWVEGSRQGGPVREVMAEEAEEPAGQVRAMPGISSAAGTPLPAAVAAPAPPSGAPVADPGIPSTPPPPRNRLARSARALRPAATDILLLIQRQNE